VARVGSGQPFMVWVWKISPKNVKFFHFFPSAQKKSLRVGSKSTQVKGGSTSYLLRVKSKHGSGLVRAHLYLNIKILQSKPKRYQIGWELDEVAFFMIIKFGGRRSSLLWELRGSGLNPWPGQTFETWVSLN